MSLVIFIILVVAAVIWWGRGSRGLSYNERQYLKRRGYADETLVSPPAPVAENSRHTSRLHTALDSLADLSPNARLRAAQDLGKLCDEGKGDPVMFTFLITALEDQDATVRRAAAETLGKLNDPRGIEYLRRRLEVDDSIHFQIAAKRALDALQKS